jgi:hypothetical protein
VQACGSQLVNPCEAKPFHDALGACAYSLCQDRSRRAAFRTKDARPAGFICPNLHSIGSDCPIVFNLDGLDSGHQLSLIEVGWMTRSDGHRPFGRRGGVAVTGQKRPHRQVADSGRSSVL